ncbi:hypothetical protein J7K93_00145 [bacterium]|nr:hypothetical protein [bacterium]
MFFLFLLIFTACRKNTALEPLNSAPQIIQLTATTNVIFVTESIEVKCVATDPDGDSLNYYWDSAPNSIRGQGSSVTWIAPEKAAQYSITCKVSDGKAEDSSMLEIYVFDYDTLAFVELSRRAHESLWVPERGKKVFRESEEWVTFWDKHIRCTPYWIPAIDFDSLMVIGVFLGALCGCTNYNPVIESVVIAHDTIVVATGDGVWTGSCLAETTDMHLITIKKNDLPVVFVYKPE